MTQISTPGRPRVGVTTGNLPYIHAQLAGRVAQGRIDRWLKEGADPDLAVAAFAQLPSPLDGEPGPLEGWCQRFLSRRGWQRLLANIRQWRYSQGSQSEILGSGGEPVRRPRRKPVRLAGAVHRRLMDFANRHGLSVDEAVDRLLQDSTSR